MKDNQQETATIDTAYQGAILCAECEALRNPIMLGLPDEQLDQQPWLTTFSDADEARHQIRHFHNAGAKIPVWVAGSDQVDAINLAAALCSDGVAASLVSFKGTGSLYSRARIAGIEEVLGQQEFLERFSACKQRFSTRQLSTSETSTSHQPMIGVSASSEPLSEALSSSIESAPTPEACSVPIQPMPEATMPLEAVPKATAPASLGSSSKVTVSSPKPTGEAIATSTGRAEEATTSLSQCLSGRNSSNGFSCDQVEKDQFNTVSNPAQKPTTLVSGASAPSQAFILAVVSAEGGSGKSAVAALAAMYLQSKGCRTVLVDGDLQGGDLGYLTDEATSVRLDDLIGSPARIEALKPHDKIPALVTAPAHVEVSEQVAPQFKQVIDQLSERFDAVVVNTGSEWGDVQLDVIAAASRTVFLIGQQPWSLKRCRHVLDLCARCGVASQSFLFAVNHCTRQALLTSIDVSCALSGAHAVELQEGGKVVSEYLGSGQPSELLEVKNAFAQSVFAMVDGMAPALAGGNSSDQAVHSFSFNPFTLLRSRS